MEERAALFRAVALGVAAAVAVAAAGLLLRGEGTGLLAVLQGLLVLLATFWLAFGASLALLGLLPEAPPPPEADFLGRAVVLVPICNEDPRAVFARISAMDAELHLAGIGQQVDIAILSDTRREDIAAQEAACFRHLLTELGVIGRIFYRRRADNRGRKAGNVEDFIRRSGAAYEAAVILDADSLMSGHTIARMLRRLAGDPGLGLLQTVPVILGAQSRFGRMMAFSGSFHGPVFARGLACLQGRTGPFWGHNAAIRVRAFAESCGLPELAGAPPFGGHVLSHDYVEAALLARAGWTVRLDPDLGGSFEEGPETILSYAKRDRRWCQGNLQHARILLAPGMRAWSRFVFLQGIFAYLAPVLWLAFVLLSLVAPAPVEGSLLLAGLVLGLLFAPKLLVALCAGERAELFGGRLHLFASVVAEVGQSSLVAPVLLMFQARSVVQVLLGRDGGWPPTARGDGALSWSEGWRAAWWITLWGLALLFAAAWLAPALLPWLLPLAGPMILAPNLIAWTSRPAQSRLFATPDELLVPTVSRRTSTVELRWSDHLPPEPTRQIGRA
ncbi:Glucans biosynthesis glucosyltransferase H [Rubellimicrobium mesophilum DSM 19309]|uniref:Glucans biosynthesis glucosyltransferase H n=1 Tax=Rubellimicrobium mesophilum DSM 19309 TaxID=442562 RepID=A0A017HUE1_9RHOB|nr:glucans biosynthesis glucosyltransferase MdoH [Rubellimicrobium mesophilum]EYD78087.1 Glucans biosynthesis glucosyltransferase H [Rubellimicrobium mesophilum DSM 19309]